MTHLKLDPLSYQKPHPGASRAGNAGFYAFVGVAAVALLILLGIYAVATDALQGFATMVGSSGR
jgi:hypothetical protein